MSEVAFVEPLLKPDDNRHVMFPIQYDDIWQMYKRQVDCFWIVNEVNLAQDLNDWSKLLHGYHDDFDGAFRSLMLLSHNRKKSKLNHMSKKVI